ncbi:acetylglutamate/acetylaminoadipate kinase [Halobaculum magnesiiphilum]|uniref:acetylglutamate/acetylaminoadipate kinase n=1 Tax=Halobaculum magnesiiphilum TaxID=1017351 RepID=UPI003CE51968
MSWPGAAAVADGEVLPDGGDGPPVVVKLGGARAVDPAGAVGDVAHLVANGRDVVVVHGGSTAVDDLLDRLGIESEYVETPSGVTGRFTDAETMEAFTMAMAGQVNTDLVTAMKNAGVDAVGLSGVDGGLLTGPRKSAVRVVEDGKKKIKRGDHSGTPKQVNEGLLSTLLADGYTPVVSPPMFGMESESEGTPVNTDADRAAAAVAGALGAELVVLTDVAGVYADPDDPDTLIESVATGDEYDALTDAAEGFMTRKVMAATEALESGATAVTVADANVRDPIVAALDGAGTRIERSALIDGGEAHAGGDAADAEVDG